MAKIIAVTSGKGGVGKSTVSVGLGQTISKKGKTAVIVELDSGLRGIDIMLGVENEVVYDFDDLASGRSPLENVAVPIESFPGLSLIVAPTGLPGGLDIEKMAETICRLEEYFDYIILDMPAGVALSLLLIPLIADIAIVVATPDYISVRDSNKLVSAFAERGFYGCRLLINKVNINHRRMNAIRDLDEVLDGVGVPLLGVLSEDLPLRNAFSNGQPMAEESDPEVIFDRIVSRLEGTYIPLYIQ